MTVGDLVIPMTAQEVVAFTEAFNSHVEETDSPRGFISKLLFS